MNRTRILSTVLLILLAGNVFLGVEYLSVVRQLRQTKTALDAQKTNDKVLAFTQLFVEKVLNAQTEVDFDTRLKLENAVRDLGDDAILAQWSKFVESKTEDDAQEQVKALLGMLVDKIKVK
ncbi:hypothetical protein KJ925_04450 [Patescibacteria group bacterium]|nr:hypothetical protein [Patescibacteria group bacterium]